MPLYQLFRPLVFQMSAEAAHDLTIKLLSKTQNNFCSLLYKKKRVQDPITLAGLRFPNRVGLAAGLDKEGTCLDGFGHLGFGSIEIGTITPKPQSGNPKPRIFRLPDAQALINSCGFNNEGVSTVIENIRHANFRKNGGILGINIGKNKDTPLEKANDDYVSALEAVYPFADYIAINISSPNTQNLRELQNDKALDSLLSVLVKTREALIEKHGSTVPLFLKIAPDLVQEQVEHIAKILLKRGIDGVIATNTSIDKKVVAHLEHGQRAGGLSGAPLRKQSNHIIQQLRHALGAGFPIIGVGGVMSAQDALDKINAGADMVQIYTGLIYKGPNLVGQVAKALADKSA